MEYKFKKKPLDAGKLAREIERELGIKIQGKKQVGYLIGTPEEMRLILDGRKVKLTKAQEKKLFEIVENHVPTPEEVIWERGALVSEETRDEAIKRLKEKGLWKPEYD